MPGKERCYMKEKRPIWNWMGSPILTKAVEKNIISEIEAEVLMENAVYERSWNFISMELEMTTKIAVNLYNGAIPKLRKWIRTSVIIMPKGKVICD